MCFICRKPAANQHQRNGRDVPQTRFQSDSGHEALEGMVEGEPNIHPGGKAPSNYVQDDGTLLQGIDIGHVNSTSVLHY